MFKKSRNLLMAAILDFFKNGAILILFFAKTLITLVLICSTMLFSALQFSMPLFLMTPCYFTGGLGGVRFDRSVALLSSNRRDGH